MDKYSAFDYLCNEPFYVEGIGTLKPPTLRDIRKVSYNLFNWYVNIISISKEKYIESVGLSEQYKLLSDKQKEFNSLYRMLIYDKNSLIALINILNMFLEEKFTFNKDTICFEIYTESADKDGNTQHIQVGHIGNDNFDIFREELQKILGITEPVEEKKKFKNKMAEKLYEKMQKNAAKIKAKQDENMSIDNMIKKYCTHNKVGINILNVWDLTYYQFRTMFSEYCNGRQCDFNDAMAANTFSYKKSSDYKPMDYMKKL